MLHHVAVMARLGGYIDEISAVYSIKNTHSISKTELDKKLYLCYK